MITFELFKEQSNLSSSCCGNTGRLLQACNVSFIQVSEPWPYAPCYSLQLHNLVL